MLALSDTPLVDACRVCAREGKLLVAGVPAGDPLLSTLRECWEACRRAMRAGTYGSRPAGPTFLECCFACDDCADACELRSGEGARRCAAAFRRCAAACWELAAQPEYCGA